MTKLWGGRFSKKTDPRVEEFTRSIHFDRKLAAYDCIGSLTHIDILKKANLISSKEHKHLQSGLEEILQSIRQSRFPIDETAEDIHTAIQQALEKKVGKVALKLHTCRSRNDQVVFATKLFCMEEIKNIQKLLEGLRQTLFDVALENSDIYLPGYTHLQHAMPVRLVDVLLAYEEMFTADQKRLQNVYEGIHLNMGSGALAGTFIDAKNYNQAVHSVLPERLQVKSTTNSIYTVSDRDFVVDLLNALSITGMHASRLAEDFILWATQEFDFIDIDESFCTGSSLMPQKKNPDVLELIRGYSGRLYGNLVNVLVVLKGLPLSYNRDLQHDKEPLFDSLRIVNGELSILTALLKKISFKKTSIERQLDDELLYATDLADHLVKSGVPFKEAHSTIGKLVSYKLAQGKDLIRMSAEELKVFSPFLTPAVIRHTINPKHSVQAKKSVTKRIK